MQSLLYGFAAAEARTLFFRRICSTQFLQETHYDVLKLPRTCSNKDIRSAFIKLSKQYHPDRNKSDADTHKLFVRLNEAYTVLSRPDSRREYDLSLVPPAAARNAFDIDINKTTAFRDRCFWDHQDYSKYSNDNKPYYGIRGIKKTSNGWVLVMCLLFGVLGVGLQILLIRYSVTFSREALDRESQQNQEYYSQAREKALRDGNEKLFERIEMNALEHEKKINKLQEKK